MRLALPLVLCLLCQPLAAAPLELFARGAAAPWSFFTDRVMGGVSQGDARLAQGAIQMRGEVSTANNGGFIQVRRAVQLPAGAQSIRMKLRGNGQRYYLHLRTRGTRLPWQYYQAGFDAPENWTEVTVPLTAFRPSGRVMSGTLRADQVRSLAIVAYGRDHEAWIEVAEIHIDP